MNYEQKFGDLVQMYGIQVCYRCNCTARTYELGHSRAHAHCKEMKICLSAVPRGYVSFFTALHEMGHCLALRGSYSSSYPRALAEHNATEWAKEEMRKLGLPLKRKEMQKYKSYISDKISRGLRRDLQELPSALRQYTI